VDLLRCVGCNVGCCSTSPLRLLPLLRASFRFRRDSHADSVLLTSCSSPATNFPPLIVCGWALRPLRNGAIVTLKVLFFRNQNENELPVSINIQNPGLQLKPAMEACPFPDKSNSSVAEDAVAENIKQSTQTLAKYRQWDCFEF
jgi:hypothetical protein